MSCCEPDQRKYAWESWEKIPAEMQEDIIRRGGAARNILVKHPDLLPEHQLQIAQEGDTGDIWLLAMNRNLIPEVQEIVIEKLPSLEGYAGWMDIEPHLQWNILHKERGAWESLARRSDLLPEIQEYFLAEASDDEDLLAELADCAALTLTSQRALAATNNPEIVGCLVENFSLDPTVERELYESYPELVEQIARRTNNISLLDEIMNDATISPELLAAAVSNHNFSDERQVRLAMVVEPKGIVFKALLQRGNLCFEAQEELVTRKDVKLKDIFTLFIYTVKIHPELKDFLLGKRGFDEVLARSSRATPEDLERLLATGRYDSILAGRRDLPNSMQKVLIEQCTEHDLTGIATWAEDPQILRRILEIGSESARERALASEHFQWTDDDLVPMARTSYPYLLEEVRSRPGVDTETWDGLVDNWQGSIKDLLEACTLV